MWNLSLLKKAMWGALVGLVTPIFPLLQGIAVLIVIDIATGMFVSRVIKKTDLTSKRFFSKISQVVVFAVGLLAMLSADQNLQVFGLEGHFGARLFCALYAFYELFSILENLGNMGLPIAKELRDYLLAKKNDAMGKANENKENN